VKAYYDARAPEYDDWYEARGLHAAAERPGWEGELAELERVLRSLAPAPTLDVACGTGYLTRWLPGPVTGLDQSARMLAVARTRVPEARLVLGDALELPFPDGSFARVFTGHFYGHLERAERERFLAEARRVASELVVVDASVRHADEPEYVQERALTDGSRWLVYKRHFDGEGLAAELGGGEIMLDGRWFVAVRKA
jgi:ubiquinone/menaquinone biosynthesis C-methylase UbiE